MRFIRIAVSVCLVMGTALVPYLRADESPPEIPEMSEPPPDSEPPPGSEPPPDPDSAPPPDSLPPDMLPPDQPPPDQPPPDETRPPREKEPKRGPEEGPPKKGPRASTGGTIRSSEQMAGSWLLETRGVKGEGMAQMTGSSVIEFLPRRTDKKEIKGKLFGQEIVESSLDAARAGGRVAFKVVVESGGRRYRIALSGKLSAEGGSIVEGEFKTTTGEGTFTASKQ